MRTTASILITLLLLVFVSPILAGESDATKPLATDNQGWLSWKALPDLPDRLGVAGPFVGVHNDALIIAGGANFPVSDGEDLWAADKIWHDDVWVLTRDGDQYKWRTGFKLNRAIGYGMCVSTSRGIVCIGGNNGKKTFADVFLLQWDAVNHKLIQSPLSPLPAACAFGAATLIGDTIYVAGGQREGSLESATTNFWRLTLPSSDSDLANTKWQALPAWPGPARAFNITIAQHNGFDDCVYIIGGRRQQDGVEGLPGIVPMDDVYEFNPKRFDAAEFNETTKQYNGQGEFATPWRKRSDAPKPIMAGTAIALGQSHIFIIGGASGELLKKIEKDEGFAKVHPGFAKHAWSYHTIDRKSVV